MFNISSADVFRQRQTVADLRFVATTAHPAVLTRIASGVSGLDPQIASRHVASGATTFQVPEHDDLISVLLLAAALPDDDFPAFIVSTAMLLLDRLQKGGLRDDLYWNWDAFADHYRLADDAERAAIMGGFRCLMRVRDLYLSHPPTDADCMTWPEFLPMNGSTTAEEAGRLWTQRSRDFAPLKPEERRMFRHLAERAEGMAPPDPNTCPTVPPMPITRTDAPLPRPV